MLRDLNRLQWSWMPAWFSSLGTAAPTSTAGEQLWELPHTRINCGRQATSLKCDKSLSREVEQNTWLVINCLRRSLDSPKPQRFPELWVPRQLTWKIDIQTPWKLLMGLDSGFDFESSVVLLQKGLLCFLRKIRTDSVLCAEGQGTTIHWISLNSDISEGICT